MSAVTHHFVSGSDFSTIIPEGDPPVAGMMLMKDGSVQIFMSEPPDPEDIDSLTSWGEACDVTEYLLYAMERADWISDYQHMQHKLWLDAMAEKDRLAREKVRSKLKLIQGGKADSG